MNIGILCPSEIALRRFMPALIQTDFHFVGLAVSSPEERFGSNFPNADTVRDILECERKKATVFTDTYGGKIFSSYEEIVRSDEVEALYIPLPPGLHFKWAEKALLAGKHVLVEKPSTMTLQDTRKLISIARDHSLALHENYMFNFHSQLDEIDSIIRSGEIGSVRLYTIKFGFPMRAANDFRYVKNLGGGALIDAGGYCIKYATRLLGDTAKIAYSQLNYESGFEVDLYGSGALINDNGTTVQIAFGMDNDYRCELEAWGSKATLRTGRVLTAPAGFEPTLSVSRNGVAEERKLHSDDAFKKSIQHFKECVLNDEVRNKNYKELENQAALVEEFFYK